METDLPTAVISPDSAPHDLDETNASGGSQSSPEQQHDKEGSGNDSESGSGNDSESESSGSDSSDEEDDNDSNDSGNNDGLSKYERLRLMRIQKNEERLRQLGLWKNQGPANPKSAASKRKAKRKNTTRQSFEPARRQPKREVKGKLPEELLSLSGLAPARESKKKKARCGECEGCTREEDCNTCIYCVERMNGKGKGRRCIFKACRGNYKKEKADVEDDNDPEQPTNEEHEHSDQCAVCANGGDLILCDACPRGFHSNCHGKIVVDSVLSIPFC
jgi:hypothetical protein